MAEGFYPPPNPIVVFLLNNATIPNKIRGGIAAKPSPFKALVF
jgi:hypothetical protein